MKPHLVVVGKNGQLGHALFQLSQQISHFDWEFVGRDELDLLYPDSIATFFSNKNPQIIINAAAYTTVDKAETEIEAAYTVNAQSVGELAKIAHQKQAKFIHVSTDYVFDGKNRKPYLPDDDINPQNVYGKSKARGEQLALFHHPKSIIIRTSWVYGNYGKNFVHTMLRLMAEKEQISVVNDQIGSPTWVFQLAETIVAICQQIQQHTGHPHGVYHFCNSGEISWFDFATAIKDISKSSCIVNPIPTTSYPTPAKRAEYTVLNCQKIIKDFNINIMPWKEALTLCLQQYNTQYGN